MTNHHDALIIDSEPITWRTICALCWAEETTPLADTRLMLSTPSGLRTVDICGDPRHGDLDGPEFVPASTALDSSGLALEAAVNSAFDRAYWTSLIERAS